MSEIDWSKAPEGADKYNTHNGCFYRGNRPNLQIYDDGKWRESRILPKNEKFVARPSSPAWNGEGLPPVGAVCEYSLNAFMPDAPWYSCEVRYVLDNDQDPDADGWEAVIWCPHLEKEQVARADRFSFRPVRTPEQIAAEERDKAVEEMHDLVGDIEKIPTWTDALRALYDAGYRKVEP